MRELLGACTGQLGQTLPSEAPSVLPISLLVGFRRGPNLCICLPPSGLPSCPANPEVPHPSHSRSISSSEKSSGPARGSSKKGRMSTWGPSNHSWCPEGKTEMGASLEGWAPKWSLWPSPPQPQHPHPYQHSLCSKQQFRRVPTTPPLRTEESANWVRGSSRWTTHLKGGTTQCHSCSLPPPPRERPGLHLSGSSRKVRAAGRWLRLESTGPR